MWGCDRTVRIRLRRSRVHWGTGRRRERGLINPATRTALQVLDMGKATIMAYHAEGPSCRKAIQDRCRGGGTCQHPNGLPGNQDHARVRRLGLLRVLNRLLSLLG